MIRIVRLLSALLVASLAVSAYAAPARKAKPPASAADRAAQAIPTAMESRIVRYTYSPDIIFRIFSRPTLHTHIELGEDEGLKETPVIGDSAQWRVSGGPRNLYVKPIREDIETSLTVVTTKRTYQFQLISAKGSQLFQKVTFDFPDREAEIRMATQHAEARVAKEQDRLDRQIVTQKANPEDLDFDFRIKGDAPFRPTSVFTDGSFTYLRMPNPQDLPAIFLVDDDDKPSLVNYRVTDSYIVVDRVAQRLLLKLDKQEVRITYNGAPR